MAWKPDVKMFCGMEGLPQLFRDAEDVREDVLWRGLPWHIS